MFIFATDSESPNLRVVFTSITLTKIWQIYIKSDDRSNVLSPGCYTFQFDSR